MLINEGLPYHLIQSAKQQIDLRSATAGILGMAFKAESDDPRDSLSYKLRKLLLIEAHRLLCADPYVEDDRLVPQDTVIAESDVLFIGVPHKRYRELTLPEGKVVIDVWNCLPSRSDATL
jgi:UDP-N-acetyl-D-mannosaminuronic acid dehydrogenase